MPFSPALAVALFLAAALSPFAALPAAAQQLPCNPVYQPCTPTGPGAPDDPQPPGPIHLPGF